MPRLVIASPFIISDKRLTQAHVTHSVATIEPIHRTNTASWLRYPLPMPAPNMLNSVFCTLDVIVIPYTSRCNSVVKPATSILILRAQGPGKLAAALGMVVGFLGYVCTFSDMSFWGGTVILTLVLSVPGLVNAVQGGACMGIISMFQDAPHTTIMLGAGVRILELHMITAFVVIPLAFVHICICHATSMA